MKKRIACFWLCAVMVFGMGACKKSEDVAVETDQAEMTEEQETAADPVLNETETAPTQPEEIDGQVVQSEDGKYQVAVPSGWEVSEDKQDDLMTMELQGPSDDQYAGIMVIDKASVGTMDIAAYMDRYAEGAAQEFAGASIGEKYPMDVNGKQAYYMVITGKVENVSYVSWVYAIDAGDSIYVATASAYPINSEAAELAFQEIVYSFQGVDEVPTTQE